MVDVNQYVGSFLKADDIPAPQLVTVERFEETEMGGEKKLVMFFQGVPKGLVMNATNINLCRSIFGSGETDHWAGRQIVLYVDPHIPFQGRMVAGLRLKMPEVNNVANPAPAAQPVQQAPPAAAPQVREEEIPF